MRGVTEWNSQANWCMDRALSTEKHIVRSAEGRQGSAVSETSRHARTSNTGTWEAFQPPRPQGRGRQSQGKSQAEDARLEGVGLGHSSEETGEQSGGCAVVESAERRAGRTGVRSRQSTGRTQSRISRVTGVCATRQFQRGAVTTGARSRVP